MDGAGDGETIGTEAVLGEITGAETDGITVFKKRVTLVNNRLDNSNNEYWSSRRRTWWRWVVLGVCCGIILLLAISIVGIPFKQENTIMYLVVRCLLSTTCQTPHNSDPIPKSNIYKELSRRSSSRPHESNASLSRSPILNSHFVYWKNCYYYNIHMLYSQ